MRILMLTYLACIPLLLTAQEKLAKPSFDLPAFLQKNLKYPDSALKYEILGKVVIRFIVTENGEVDSLTPLTNYGFGLEEEAIRVLSKMPPWQPAVLDGKNIKMYYTCPITFKTEHIKQRSTKKFREVMNDVNVSNNLLTDLKTATVEKDLKLLTRERFFQINSSKKKHYYAGADTGTYKLVLTSAHGEFYMPKDADFFFNGYKVGGFFHPFDDPGKLYFWSCAISSRDKAFKKFANQEYVDFAIASPTLSEFFISRDYIVSESSFTIDP